MVEFNGRQRDRRSAIGSKRDGVGATRAHKRQGQASAQGANDPPPLLHQKQRPLIRRAATMAQMSSGIDLHVWSFLSAGASRPQLGLGEALAEQFIV
jgi:hypothetical protein